MKFFYSNIFIKIKESNPKNTLILFYHQIQGKTFIFTKSQNNKNQNIIFDRFYIFKAYQSIVRYINYLLTLFEAIALSTIIWPLITIIYFYNFFPPSLEISLLDEEKVAWADWKKCQEISIHIWNLF